MMVISMRPTASDLEPFAEWRVAERPAVPLTRSAFTPIVRQAKRFWHPPACGGGDPPPSAPGAVDVRPDLGAPAFDEVARYGA
jgi:hypothetical protein